MEAPKIRLSPAETELMQNADVILTKNRVLQKVEGLLQHLQQRQQEDVGKSDLHTHALFQTAPKISKGENHFGLPWRILDYPRAVKGDDIFFIRTLFWWGRFFSSTLHLSGNSFDAERQQIFRSFSLLQAYHAGINDDPWLHDFSNDNYVAISSLNESEWRALTERRHLKIAVRWPLQDWESFAEKGWESWRLLLYCAGLVA